MTDIKVPELGESVSEATVGAWNFAEGDAVNKDDILVELETDKVSIEVRAEEAGTLTKIVAAEGDTVEIGAKLAELGSGDAAASEDTSTEEPAEEDAHTGASADEAPVPDDSAGEGGNLVEAKIPEMGESVTEGTVGAWLVDVGAAVKKDQALVEIETDKVAVEVPCPVDGVLEERSAEEGDTVSPGDIVAKIREGGSVPAAEPKAEPAAEETSPEPAPSSEVKAMPSAARIAEEENIDLSKIEGTGKDGRVTKGDALKALDGGAEAPASAAPAPAAPREDDPREERVKMTRLRRTIANRLKDAQNTAAMLTTFNEADMSAIMAARKQHQDAFVAKHGVKLGFMSFFVKACVNALKDIPNVNAEIDGEDIVYKNYYDMGVAVSTERGLVVPVVRGADTMSLADIEKKIIELGTKARDGKLTIDEMQGATFTLSNGGIFGSLLSTPILNAPQSGILGMHKIQERPVAENGQVVIRPMMYLALSYDHRIVDGKEAVTFLVRVKEALEDPQRLLFDI
ncbi:2-oxoglutarate dehydrogenase complex dihydrolipoyllysine-residue succinyltransferase [Hyphobacterium sp. HN65]|uniref:Dihydrolipoyllysine-residue succinyltransferase component of 2-oxoglutarate dehydrogenase complex n=1 Tax=Hyphobacterium lacteum TaxID=3116575 RepID=A0ABU7LSL5_9PROT|nr:2-oxoglutarate dehydrogenase complex dihydrolipoyllysine-residue succinyltransferase [Hyphobacterium sp. HN65]MEE2526910.1 2-oxoglutarate dehydrogenase complex dihydrolipoyllysine-residue succinyltransferase [Hyphobacterium sp. HN65]